MAIPLLNDAIVSRDDSKRFACDADGVEHQKPLDCVAQWVIDLPGGAYLRYCTTHLRAIMLRVQLDLMHENVIKEGHM